MQRQYSLHSSMLRGKLLCQHRLLTSKVTVSCREGGGMDGRLRATQKDRHYRRQESEKSDTAVAAVHLVCFPLISHFHWPKSFCRGMN